MEGVLKNLRYNLAKLAKRLEEETAKQSPPPLNVDKEYEDMKKILASKQKEKEESEKDQEKQHPKPKSISRVETLQAIESTNPDIQPKYNSPSVNRKISGLLDNSIKELGKDGILYSIKGQHRYKYGALSKNAALMKQYNSNRGIINANSSQKDIETNSKILSLGIVGEQLSGSVTRKVLNSDSSRKLLKGNSLDMKLPKISDNTHIESLDHNVSIGNVKLPTLSSKYSQGV